MPDSNAIFERLSSGPLKSLSSDERAIFRDRMDAHWEDCLRPLRQLYGERADFSRLPQRIMRLTARAYAGRPRSLREADLKRLSEPDWFQQTDQVGYLCHADRFADTLKGVSRQAAYLEELGVSQLHLLPLLAPRDGDNDGGRAVQDHRRVDPRLGSMGDLAALARRLRRSGIALGTDLVCDRTAAEHAWAQKALAGDAKYQDYFLMYADRALPDQFERTVPDACPGTPGNFTWVEAIERWVWTSYQDYQWDLDYSNPDVFGAMLDNLLYLANRGPSLIRLDGVARLWKRLGTNCANLPETDLLLQAWRAFSRIAAPGVLLWAKDDVSDDEPQRYLGHGVASGKQALLASHNTLMMMLWSSLAERNVRLATSALGALPRLPETTAWINFARDDAPIDWHVADRHADAAGVSAPAHREFLEQFYSGEFPGSFARGASSDNGERFGSWQTQGSVASLTGLSIALEKGDGEAAELAVKRMMMIYGVLYAFGGIPFICMGDELGVAGEHDMPMDWQRAEQRTDTETVTGRIFQDLVRLGAARRRAFMLHAAATCETVLTGNDRVLGIVRASARGQLVVLANSSDEPQTINRFDLGRLGLPEAYQDWLADVPSVLRGDLTLGSYECVWLSAPETPL